MEFHLAQIVFVWKIPLMAIGEQWSYLQHFEPTLLFLKGDIFWMIMLFKQKKNSILYF